MQTEKEKDTRKQQKKLKPAMQCADAKVLHTRYEKESILIIIGVSGEFPLILD